MFDRKQQTLRKTLGKEDFPTEGNYLDAIKFTLFRLFVPLEFSKFVN